METELFRIFNEDGTYKGIAAREDVHKKGFWHETFHCWFVSRKDDVDYIYLQIRSHAKKDYPNLLNITAAGHILANETVRDGLREVKEEVGIVRTEFVSLYKLWLGEEDEIKVDGIKMIEGKKVIVNHTVLDL